MSPWQSWGLSDSHAAQVPDMATPEATDEIRPLPSSSPWLQNR